MSFRIKKIESLLKDELSSIFLFKIQTAEFGLITITSVKVSPDLRIAKVYISVFNRELRPQVLEKVKSMNWMIRSEIAKRVSLRFVPDFQYYIDDAADYVEKINNLIKQIHENDNKKND